MLFFLSTVDTVEGEAIVTTRGADRELALVGATCADVIEEIRSPRFNRCTCSLAGSTGGATVNATCRGCSEVCILGACGSGYDQVSYEFETDGSATGERRQCFEYVSGVNGTICRIENRLRTSCAITLDNEACSSCEMRDCGENANGSQLPRQAFANCTNLLGGNFFDFCEPVTVSDTSSAFIAMDSTFAEDIDECNSGSTANKLYFNALGSLSMVSAWLILQTQ